MKTSQRGSDAVILELGLVGFICFLIFCILFWKGVIKGEKGELILTHLDLIAIY